MAVPATALHNSFALVTPEGADTFVINDDSDTGATKTALVSAISTALGLGTLSTQGASAIAVTGGSLDSVTATTITITSGSINGVPIGATTPSTIAGTTGAFSGDVTVSGSLTATNLIGNGAAITGITGATGGVSNTGSTTISADTDVDGVGVIALQTRNVTRITIENAGSVTFTGAVTGITALSIASMGANWTNAGRTIADLGTVSAATSITSTAFVGGTITGTTVSVGTILQGTTANGYLDIKGDSGQTTAHRFSDTGNVGFNTADLEAWDSSFRAQQLSSNAAIFWSHTSAVVGLTQNAYFDGASIISNAKYRGTDEAAMYVQNSSGTHTFYVAPSGTIDTAITWITALTITNAAGYVGIGQTTPASPLHVKLADTKALPVLTLEQLDVSEEMIEFITTIGVGNAIEAAGAKVLTSTHFIKVTIPGGLTRYIPCGTIA